MDKNTNPATLDVPVRNPEPQRDKNSNPATYAGLGGITARAEPGEVQTTIDTETTTIHPETSIVNPVTPEGTEADVKRQAPHPAVAADVDKHVADMKKQVEQQNKGKK